MDAAKAACWSTRDREARRLELTPGSDSVGTQSLTSLLTSMHFCVRTVIAHQCLLRPLYKLLIYVHNLLLVFVCKKVAKLISIWLKKIWTFSHIG